jgi:hypothetical protein
VVQLFQVVNTLDVFDLVVTQVQAAQLGKGVEAFDVRDEVVV